MPKPEKDKRERLGDELQPWGDYAHIDPIGQLVTDITDVQSCEADDPEFYNNEWWGWTHQRLRFLNSKLGIKVLLLAFPFIWATTILFGGAGIGIWGIITLSRAWDFPALLFIVLLLAFSVSWIFLSIYIIANTTNWIMSQGIGFLIKPFEKTLQRRVDNSLADGMSEFNRATGLVKFALRKGRYFEAPFIEFDAYVERVVQRGGIFYRLMFVHRYTGKTFNKTWLSGVEADKGDVLALWVCCNVLWMWTSLYPICLVSSPSATLTRLRQSMIKKPAAQHATGEMWTWKHGSVKKGPNGCALSRSTHGANAAAC